jgi:hypothetical protein
VTAEPSGRLKLTERTPLSRRARFGEHWQLAAAS